MANTKRVLGTILTVLLGSSTVRGASSPWPFEVTDLSQRDRLVILVFGDSGTGEAGQYRVGAAMVDVCRQRGCDLALMLGDNIYENGIEVRNRTSADASYREILDQFAEKFEKPYRSFSEIPGFRFWAILGNHDYRKNAMVAFITYSQFSDLWRLPSFHYQIPSLPEWIQIYGIHTDTDVRRDLNGLQVESARRALCEERTVERWKLVFGHHPVYNSGHHSGDANEQRARALLEEPLFRRCGVHVYFAGHAHHQEHLTARGFEQVIQGAAARTKGRNRSPKDPSVSQRHFSREFGFAVVEADRERMRIDFYHVLETREKSSERSSPQPHQIVLAYSWCGTRAQTGRPEQVPQPCAPAAAGLTSTR